MRLYNAVLRDHGIKEGIAVHGIGLGNSGPGQTCLVVPIKSHPQDDPPDPRAWGLRPSTSGLPQIVANADPTPGSLVMLTTYNRVDIRLGNIYVLEDSSLDDLMVVGYGVGGNANGSVLWDEALVQVTGDKPVRFFLENVGPPNTLVVVTGEEVFTEELTPSEQAERLSSDLIRIDDPRLNRWKRPPRKEIHAQE